MALSANTVWNVRTGGSDNNGGAFVSGATGVNRSLQDGAHATPTGTVHTTTTQMNVVGHTVHADDIGNLLQVTAGTATAGFYQITNVDVPNNRWTMDRSMGTSTQTITTSAMGGALASPGKASGAATVAQMIIYIKSGTYTIASATGNIATGCMTLSQRVYVEGYDSTQGDLGTPPLLQASGISTFTIIAQPNSSLPSNITNITVDGAALTSSRGFGCCGTLYKCKALNCTNSGFAIVSSQAATIVQCQATGCSTQPAFVGTFAAFNCIAWSNTITGFSCGTNSGCFVRCVSVSNSGASSDGFTMSGNRIGLYNCIAYNNGRDGFRIAAGQIETVNCIGEDNAGWGFNASANTDGLEFFHCAGFSNTSGEINVGTGKYTRSLNFVTGSSSFFTNAGSGDFSLNNTAGAGADAREAGIPGAFYGVATTSYLDIGAAQHQEAAVTGGGSYVF